MTSLPVWQLHNQISLRVLDELPDVTNLSKTSFVQVGLRMQYIKHDDDWKKLALEKRKKVIYTCELK